MSQVLNETVVSLKWIQEKHPTAISLRTVRRWCYDGLLDSQGRRVLLESARLGGERVTSVEAYRRFNLALNQ